MKPADASHQMDVTLDFELVSLSAKSQKQAA